VIASGAVRPSSSAQLWMCGQSWCPSWRPGSVVVSARVMAVMAVLRSRVWPGSQDTSQPFRSGACRAVWALWSLTRGQGSGFWQAFAGDPYHPGVYRVASVALALALTSVIVPDSRPPALRRAGRPGQGLVLILLACLTAGIISGPGAGWLAPETMLLFAASAASLALLLAYEHSLVSPRDLRRLNAAFFTMNGVIATVFLAFVAADIWLRF